MPASSSGGSRSAPTPGDQAHHLSRPGDGHPPLLELPEPRRAFTPERVTQTWFFQDLLQGLSEAKRPGLGRAGDPETGARGAAGTHARQREDAWGSHTAASPREPRQRPPGERQVPGAGPRQQVRSRDSNASTGRCLTASHLCHPPGDGDQAASTPIAEDGPGHRARAEVLPGGDQHTWRSDGGREPAPALLCPPPGATGALGPCLLQALSSTALGAV